MTRRCRASVLAEDDALELLTRGRMELEGRLVDASNTTLRAEITLDGLTAPLRLQAGPRRAPAVGLPGRHPGRPRGRPPTWSPRRPAGTWSRRPSCATARSASGACQLWIDEPDGRRGADRLRARRTSVPPGWFAVAGGPRRATATRTCSRTPTTPGWPGWRCFDAVINNADRKGGHVLYAAGRPDLRRRPRRLLPRREQAAHGAVGLGRQAAPDGGGRASCTELRRRAGRPRSARLLEEHLTVSEVQHVRLRVKRLLRAGRFPRPPQDWPAVPWPPV